MKKQRIRQKKLRKVQQVPYQLVWRDNSLSTVVNLKVDVVVSMNKRKVNERQIQLTSRES